MNKKEKADKLIAEFAFGSSLTSFIPIPAVDLVGLIGVQRLMLYKLSKIYGVSYSKELAKVLVSTLMGSLAASQAAPLLSVVVKLIPGIGTITGGTSLAVLSSSSTYAIGKAFQQHFEKGGNLNDFVPENAKELLQQELAKGKNLYTTKKVKQK